MAKSKKTPKPRNPTTPVHRVNLTLSPDEFEMLEQAAAQVKPLAVKPTVYAKLLVMKALSDGDSPFAEVDAAKNLLTEPSPA